MDRNRDDQDITDVSESNQINEHVFWKQRLQIYKDTVTIWKQTDWTKSKLLHFWSFDSVHKSIMC